MDSQYDFFKDIDEELDKLVNSIVNKALANDTVKPIQPYIKDDGELITIPSHITTKDEFYEWIHSL